MALQQMHVDPKITKNFTTLLQLFAKFFERIYTVTFSSLNVPYNIIQQFMVNQHFQFLISYLFHGLLFNDDQAYVSSSWCLIFWTFIWTVTNWTVCYINIVSAIIRLYHHSFVSNILFHQNICLQISYISFLRRQNALWNCFMFNLDQIIFCPSILKNAYISKGIQHISFKKILNTYF